LGGFIAAALAAGFEVSSSPARVAIFLGFAAVTYFLIAIENPGKASKWWHI
jgi:hypothetical protein